MEYLSGVIDGAVLIDGIVRSVLARASDTNEFWASYDAEKAHLWELVTKCRSDEVRAYLEENA